MANNKLLNPAKQRTYGLGNGPNKAIRTKKHSQLLQSKIKSDELANQRSHNSQTKITNKSKLQRNHVMVPEEDKIYTSVIQRIIEQQDKLRAQGKMVPRQYQSSQRDQTKINPLPRVHRTIRTRQPTYTIPKEEFLPQQQGLADLQKCILNKRSVETLLNNKLKPGKDLKEDWSSKECPGSDKTKIRMTTSEFGHDSAEKRSLRSEESDEKKEALWKLLNVSKNCNVNGQTYRKIEKELLFVRHAEGFHNSLFEEKRVREAISVRDPDLTPNGNNQVADLRREVDMLIHSGLEVEKIIVSPMTRTLQTAWGTFGGHDIPFQACHYVTEYSDAPCNYGTKKSTLQEQWPQVDFSMVPEVWWNENESEETIARRARQFREWLFKQPEKCMAVVSHAGFLHELLQEHFKNCELKRINWIHRSRKLNVSNSKYQR